MLYQQGGLGERCKLPQRSPRRSPGSQRTSPGSLVYFSFFSSKSFL